MKRNLKLRDFLDLYGGNEFDEITCFDKIIDSEFYFYKQKEDDIKFKYHSMLIEFLKDNLNIEEILQHGIVVDLYGLLDNPIYIQYVKDHNWIRFDEKTSDDDIVELLFDDFIEAIGGNISDNQSKQFLDMLNKGIYLTTFTDEDYLAYQRVNEENILNDLKMRIDERIVNGADEEITSNYVLSDTILKEYISKVINGLSNHDLYNEIYMSMIDYFLNEAYKENPIKDNSIGIYDSHNADTELNSRSGSSFIVINKLTKDDCDIDEVGNMYHVRFKDGFETDVFEDEIILNKEVSELC